MVRKSGAVVGEGGAMVTMDLHHLVSGNPLGLCQQLLTAFSDLPVHLC